MNLGASFYCWIRPARFAIALLAILACLSNVLPTIIRRAYPLTEMAEKADIIVKASAVSTSRVSDDWFKFYPGFAAYSTRMQVISVTKGGVAGSQIDFHHYGRNRQAREIASMPVQSYELELGRTYIVFCAKTGQKDTFRQLWANHTLKEDQGVYLAADDAPVGSSEAKDVLFEEFSRMLAIGGQRELLYAIRQLDEMSNPNRRLFKLNDFNRDQVLAEIAPLMSSREESVAAAAIQAVGGANPYFKNENAIFWLAKVGAGRVSGIAPWDSDQNPGAHRYYLELTRIADGMGSVQLRSLAIRALGRASRPAVLDSALGWANAAETSIREAATLLLADFHDDRVKDQLSRLAVDADARVRRVAALAIGFGQFAELLPVLNDRLRDGGTEVRRAAAQSLLSFPSARSAPTLRANMKDAEYGSVFVNALAFENPEPYIDSLCEIVQRDQQPPMWNGTIPSAESWKILMRYVSAQSRERLESGRFDDLFDVLEGAKFFSSSEPRDLYRLYVKNGLKKRALSFRAYLRRAAPFPLDRYLDQVDAEYGFRRN